MACGFPFNPGLTPPIVVGPITLGNAGLPSAFVQIDGNDFFGNGPWDDNTIGTAFGISFATCGSPAPSISLVSRNRFTMATPGLASLLNLLIGINSPWTGQVYYKNGAPVTPMPTFTNPTADVPETTPGAGAACNSDIVQPAIVVNANGLS